MHRAPLTPAELILRYYILILRMSIIFLRMNAIYCCLEVHPR